MTGPAAAVNETGNPSPSTSERQDMWTAMGSMLQRQACAARIVPVPRQTAGPLSRSQERIWSLHQSEPESAYYNIPLAWRITGALDVAALEKTLYAIVNRYEILRTTFSTTADGNPCAVIAEAVQVPLRYFESSRFDSGDGTAAVLQAACADIARPFDLADGPLVRTALFRIDDFDHLLVFTVHQIVFDGASMRILNRDVGELYRSYTENRPARLPALPVQYADFVAWHNKSAADNAAAENISYWHRQMESPSAPLVLPADYVRQPGVATASAGREPLQLSRMTTDTLIRIARESQTTLFSVLVGALNALLRRYSYQDDITIFSSFAGRTQPEVRNLIGLIANVLPIRITLGGDPTLRELVLESGKAALGAFGHQDLPFETIMQMQPAAASGNPANQVMIIFQNAPLSPFEASGVLFTPVATVDNGAAKFDILFEIAETGDGLHGWMKYRTDVFEPGTAHQLMCDLVMVLDRVAEDPNTHVSELVPGLSPAQPQRNVKPTRVYSPARNPLEAQLVRIWECVLQVSPIGIHDNFFDLGGTSLMAATLFARIRTELRRNIRLATLIHAPTIAQIATVLEGEEPAGGSFVVPLQPRTASQNPFFFVPGVGGHVLELRAMAGYLTDAVYGFEATEFDQAGTSKVRIEDLARDYIRKMKVVQPCGPYLLGGVCFGGFVAFEMAQQLRGSGEEVRVLVLLDPPGPRNATLNREALAAAAHAQYQILRRVPLLQVLRSVARRAAAWLNATQYRLVSLAYSLLYRALRLLAPATAGKVLQRSDLHSVKERIAKVVRASAITTYTPRAYGGDLLLLQAEGNGRLRNLCASHGWRQITRGRMEVQILTAGHDNFMHEPNVRDTAARIVAYAATRTPQHQLR